MLLQAMGMSDQGSQRLEILTTRRRAWLLELARLFPSDEIQLDGFDITSSNFPAAGWLPLNMRLHVWNAFSEVPNEFVGVFDVVHIRAMYSCIIDNKVDPLLSNLLKMLKPGGVLQIDEVRDFPWLEPICLDHVLTIRWVD